MATEAKTTSKPNLMLVAAIIGGFLVAMGQGWIDVKKPNPEPTPIPAPDPQPEPDPEPKPITVNELFPALPPTYAAVSQPILSKFKKETAEDALNYARFYRDSAIALRNDKTITSNSRFSQVQQQALYSLASSYPGMSGRNVGLGKAIDDVLATQGLDIAQWSDQQRNQMAEAMDAVSARCLEAYQTLTKPL